MKYESLTIGQNVFAREAKFKPWFKHKVIAIDLVAETATFEDIQEGSQFQGEWFVAPKDEIENPNFFKE